MGEFKKLISVFMSLLMILSIIPFRASGSSVIFDENYSTLTSFEEADGWKVVQTSDYGAAEVNNGGIEIRNTACKYYDDSGNRNTAIGVTIQKKISYMIENDAENRTTAEISNISGLLRITINYTLNIVTNENTNNPYFNMSIPGYCNMRFYNNNVIVLNASSISNATLNKSLPVNGAGNSNTLVIEIDTINEKVSVTANGDTANAAYGDSEYKNLGKTPIGYLSLFSIYGMERMAPGTYFRFDSVKAEDLTESDMGDIYQTVRDKLDTFPDSLADDPYNVTGNVTIPSSISEYKWYTTDSSVMSKLGRITKTTEGTSDVSLYFDLPVTVDGKQKYVRKTYTMTVTGVQFATNTNTVNPNPGDSEKWYLQPENVDGHDGYPMYDDPDYISDDVFFGKWDSINSKWINEPYFRYDDYTGMSKVEAAAKLGDYETAKTELLNYFRPLDTSRITSVNSKPSDTYKLIYELMSRNAYATNFISGSVINLFEVNRNWNYVDIDVTTALNSAKGSFPVFSNMIASIDKYNNQTEIYSRDSDYKPVLYATVNGVTRTFECIKDATIRGGTYADTNYGSESIMYAEESGTWQNYDDRVKRIFLGFDTSSLNRKDTVTNAYVRLYARHTGSDEKKLMLYYWYNDGSWIEDKVCWNTFSDPLYFSCNDMECWDYVTPNNPSIKGKVCGYHRDVEPSYLATLYSYYSQHPELESNAEKYAYTYLRQYMGLICSIGTEPTVMNQLDMSTHISGVSTDIWRLIDSQYMTPEIFTAYLKHLWKLTDYHVYNWFGVATNNFASFSTGAVYNMCARFPEFSRHDTWYQAVVDENERIFKGFTFEDGLCLELSHNYISTILGTLSTPINTSNTTGEPLPYGEDTKNMIYDMVMSLFNTSGPYFGGFNLGDGYDPYTSYAGTFRTWYNSMFKDDPAIAYAATGGQTGWLPDESTTNYPIGQRTFMRSDWSQNALALAITNKMVGSHGHRDALSIAMFAYGKYLITDQGYGSIQTGTTSNYMRGPQQHNVVTVNDYADYLKTGDYSSFSSMTTTDGEQLEFDSNHLYDFVEYTTPAYKQTDNSQRSVMFLKNQKFWIVTDYLVPAKPEQNNVYAQNWHLYPGANMTIDSTTKVIQSHFTDEPNVMIVPVSPSDIDSTEIRNTWYSEKGGQLTDSQKGMLYKTKTGNTVYSTIIVPSDVGESFSVNTQKLACAFDENEVNCFSFNVTDNNTGITDKYYYYHLNNASEKTDITVDKYTTDAVTMMVQEDASGNFVSAYLIDGTYIKRNETVLFMSNTECESIAFTSEVGVLNVHSGNKDIKTLENCKFNSSLASEVVYDITNVPYTVVDGMMIFSDVEEYKDPNKDPSAGNVILDSSVNPELVRWSYNDNSMYKVTDMGKDGIKFENIGSKPYLDPPDNTKINSASNMSAGVHISGIIDEDKDNNTQTVTDFFTGKYALEFTIQQNIDTERTTPTYATFRFGTPGTADYKCDIDLLQLRLYTTYINAIRYENTQKDGVRNDTNGLAMQTLQADTEWKLRVVFDTVNKTYSIYINDVLAKNIVDYPYNVKYDSGKGTYTEYPVTYVPDFFVSLMDANSVGSYVWIKNVKLYEIESNTDDARIGTLDALLSSMPVKLVNNASSVTKSFNVPTVGGMEWSVSDNDVVTVDGVVDEYSDDTDVVFSLKGSFNDTDTSAIFMVGRKYNMTIKPDNWLTNLKFENGVATVSVENTADNYLASPTLILVGYDSMGILRKAKAFEVTEKIDSYRWEVGDSSVTSVKAVIVENLINLRPLKQLSM